MLPPENLNQNVSTFRVKNPDLIPPESTIIHYLGISKTPRWFPPTFYVPLRPFYWSIHLRNPQTSRANGFFFSLLSSFPSTFRSDSDASAAMAIKEGPTHLLSISIANQDNDV